MLTSEIQQVIEKSLPAAVGTVLKQRLEQLETLEKQLAQAVLLADTRQKDVDRLNQLGRSEVELQTRKTTLDARENTLVLREAKCALAETRIECAELRTKDAKDIVLAVFANSKFKYTETGNTAGYNSGSGNGAYSSLTTVPTNKRIESEG